MPNFISIKCNLPFNPQTNLLCISQARFLNPHALGKLTLYDIILSVKQNLSHVWFLRPHALGKLTLYDILLSVK